MTPRTFLCSALMVLTCALTVRAERLTLVAGAADNSGGEAKLSEPFGCAMDREGNLYFVEFTNKVRRIDAKGVVTTVAGTGEKGNSGDGGPALQATFNSPHSLAIGPNGAVYIADTFNNRIRKLDPKTGVITAFAGTGAKGSTGDGGPALQAALGGVYCICLDPAGHSMYLPDLDSRRVRKIEMASGIITSIAGNGQKGVPQDGADAKSSPLVDPRAVAVDGMSNVYVLERGGHALRVVDASGKIRTLAGTGKGGNTGDGGDARKATLNGPKHLCLDRDGNVIIADAENNVVRKYIIKTGTIVRVAGTGKKDSIGVGGLPDQCALFRPHGVYVDPHGVLFITDTYNNRILKLEQ